MKGKIIVIEGTDCSGKETQTKRLLERLKADGKVVKSISFPVYECPTGKIVGGSFLGKPSISESYFDDPATVDSKVASLYYAADRLYNIDIINKYLEECDYLLIDRYVQSNMAHQGSKFECKEERAKLFKWIETLEYDLLELPRPDLTILLYMPYEQACILKKNRLELDRVEVNEEYLRRGENTYLELAELYGFDKVDCVKDGNLKTIDEIHEEVYSLVKRNLY